MAASSVIIFAVLLIFEARNLFVRSECRIDINKDYNLSSPLILNKRSHDIIYPKRTTPQLLTFKSDQEHLIHCPGGRIIKSEVPTNLSIEVFKCVSDLTFTDASKSIQYSFVRLNCSTNPTPVTKEDNSKKCGQGGVVVNIGYQVTSSYFKTLIDLCHARDKATTIWAHSQIVGAIGGNRNKEFKQPTFSKGSYFADVAITQVYPKTSQQKMLMDLFDNDKDLVERYIPDTGNRKNYFAKGHLVARADMYYYAEQWATFFYVNALPMWQSVNNGNWRFVESAVRRLAAVEGDLDVWTGGIGVLELQGGRAVYLGRDKRNSSRRLVPAPKLLFKLVHNRATNRALVFITANDPYPGGGDEENSQVPNEYKICQEYRPCLEKFPTFRKKFEGYTYCCLYEDFMADPSVKKIELPVDFKNVKPLALY